MERYTEWDSTHTHGCGLPGKDCFTRLAEYEDAAELGMFIEWIPVTERLPENDDMVLVSCRTKKGVASVNRAYYSGSYWHGSGSMSGVEAWMPLPKPYQEACNEQ